MFIYALFSYYIKYHFLFFELYFLLFLRIVPSSIISTLLWDAISSWAALNCPFDIIPSWWSLFKYWFSELLESVIATSPVYFLLVYVDSIPFLLQRSFPFGGLIPFVSSFFIIPTILYQLNIFLTTFACSSSMTSIPFLYFLYP